MSAEIPQDPRLIQDYREKDFSFRQEFAPPEPAQPFYLPETTTFVERIGNPLRMQYPAGTEHFLEDDMNARNLFGQMVEHENFHQDIARIDATYRSNIRRLGRDEARQAAFSDLSGKVVFENGAYIYIRERMQDDQAILSPREVQTIYSTPYMKKSLRREPNGKTVPDGLMFEERNGVTYLTAGFEYTTMSGDIRPDAHDDEYDIAEKMRHKEMQVEKKQAQIYRNGTVPRQLLSERSHAWRAHLGRKIHERFGLSPILAPDPDYQTVLVVPKGRPAPVEVRNGFVLPIPLYRGMISEFSECVMEDLDDIHHYAQEKMPKRLAEIPLRPGVAADIAAGD